jgi:hypothetical protein
MEYLTSQPRRFQRDNIAPANVNRCTTLHFLEPCRLRSDLPRLTAEIKPIFHRRRIHRTRRGRSHVRVVRCLLAIFDIGRRLRIRSTLKNVYLYLRGDLGWRYLRASAAACWSSWKEQRVYVTISYIHVRHDTGSVQEVLSIYRYRMNNNTNIIKKR